MFETAEAMRRDIQIIASSAQLERLVQMLRRQHELELKSFARRDREPTTSFKKTWTMLHSVCAEAEALDYDIDSIDLRTLWIIDTNFRKWVQNKHVPSMAANAA